MQTISSLKLREAKPSDRPHLLLWDTPNDLELYHLAFQNQAQPISYRNNLLSRITPSRFLVLHERLDLELAAIKQICASSNKPVVLLEDVDCLITYLNTQPPVAPITLFWKKLKDMRHLESILWIVLPSKLAPENWPETRLGRIMTNPF